MQTQFNARGNGWRGSNPSRQLDGLSQPLTRPLESMDEKELRAQYEKTNTMLNNPNLKLPDGGAKLKAKLEQIKSLLQAQQADESNITDKVSGLSLSDKPDIRKATVLRSSQAEIHPENLLRAHPTHSHMATTSQSSHAGTRMMSLEESMQLQEAQQKDIKLANMRKKIQSIRGSSSNSTRTSESLADDLSLTMNSLQLDPETRIPRPDDDNPEDMEGEDADSDDDTTDSEDDDEDDGMDGFERYDDEGYEEDDQQVFEDGQQHNNNNRRI